MSTKRVKVVKDGQEGLVYPVQLKGLKKHGWTVVDDGNSESGLLPGDEARVSDPANKEY